MGWTTHHSITVTGRDDEVVRAREHIVQLVEVDPVMGTYPIVWVSDLSTLGINGQRTFFVAPDGSREGYKESDAGDATRKRITDWLKAQAFDDGSTPLEWIEYSFGGDDDHPGHDGPQIIDSSHHHAKRVKEQRKTREMKRVEPLEATPLVDAWLAKTPKERVVLAACRVLKS